MAHIYDLISNMKARPEMYTTGQSLAPIEKYLHGYCACLSTHGIEEDYPGRRFHPREFSIWLHTETGWSGSRGFAHAIESNTSEDDALQVFFNLIDRYRESGEI